MNSRKVYPLLIVALYSGFGYAAAERSIGVGVGPLYNGIGLSALTIDGFNAKYMAIGCLSFSVEESSSSSSTIESTGAESSSSSSDTSSDFNCGVSVGVISTSLIGSSSGRHGLGLFAGLSYNTIDYHPNDKIDLNTGISYTYFLNGLSNKRLNLGFGILSRFPTSSWDFNGTDSRTHLSLNVGYQF